MIVRIAPLLRLPRVLGIFDYLLPGSWAVPARGSVASVTFRGRKVAGIVIGIVPTSMVPPAKLRPLDSMLSVQPLIPPPLLRTIELVANEGYTSLATTLRGLLPILTTNQPFDLPPPQTEKRQARRERRPELLTYLLEASKVRELRAIVRASVSRRRSVIIIVPTDDRARWLAARLPGSIILDRGTTRTKYRAAYLDLRARTNAVVIGTRSAVFAPVRQLGCIIIDDEDADEHLQETPSPLYDVRRVAVVLSRLTGSRIVFTSRLPTLATLRLRPAIHELDPRANPPIDNLGLERARAENDYGVLTEAALDRLRSTVAAGGRACVIHPRRSTYGSLECRECGFIFTCPSCHVPMHLEQQLLRCLHCATTASVPSRCPRCQSVSLRGRVRGIPVVAAELAAALGPLSAAKVEMVTPHELANRTDDSYDLAVLTSYRSLLALPRVDADERARRTVWLMIGRLRRNGRAVLQVNDPNVPRFDERSERRWRATMIADREQFGYPPLWRTLALRRRAAPRGVSAPVTAVLERLRAVAGNVTITDPQPALGRSRRDQGGTIITLRTHGTFPPRLRSVLASLDEGWTIAIDPVSFR